LIFNPVADNVTLVQNPAARRLSGNISHIPVLGGSNSQEGRYVNENDCDKTWTDQNSVFAVGQTNVTAFLQTSFGAVPALIPVIQAAYPIGSPGLTNGYDVISAIITDLTFQCVSVYFNFFDLLSC
jgi:acetylcholinesterase